jgi:hypothetical protein
MQIKDAAPVRKAADLTDDELVAILTMRDGSCRAVNHTTKRCGRIKQFVCGKI